VHCELITGKQKDTPANGSDPKSYQDYLASRPKQWENDAIQLMIRLCSEFNCPVHIVHLSSAESIVQIRKAKQEGLSLTVETAPHYIYFSAEDIPDGQTAFKCAPPIREKANNDRLWTALQQDIIDLVGTDHSPAPPDMKHLESGDLMKAWGGIASLQLSLPIVWTGAKKRKLGIPYIAKWMCENPARLIGLPHRKGFIAKGYDADLVVWDPDKQFKVTEQLLHHKHKITPYLNEELYGVVEQTFLKGKKVFDNGQFVQLNKGEIITHGRHE
jgi:allantoinase